MIRPLPAQTTGITPMPSTTYKRPYLRVDPDPLAQWLAETCSEEDVPDHEEEAWRFGQ